MVQRVIHSNVPTPKGQGFVFSRLDTKKPNILSNFVVKVERVIYYHHHHNSINAYFKSFYICPIFSLILPSTTKFSYSPPPKSMIF
ncbi:hypothetical protein QVD17_15345 [Tagetes erecta]|uniref:Uncharacterized protein n=1 Tax=Tagetes erecta TaxID=13708 RepID=A0AAD8KS74_TARER|nr:hypothetical protein QVD17_15345 [Tagetes erecta]